MNPVEKANELGHDMADALPYGTQARFVCRRCMSPLVIDARSPEGRGTALERGCQWAA